MISLNKHEEKVTILNNIGEYFAAGYVENMDKSPFIRFSSAIKRHFENVELPSYNGELLYPFGEISKQMAVRYDFSRTCEIFWKSLSEKDEEIVSFVREYIPGAHSIANLIPPEHSVGGAMYTHSHVNFNRIASEGLNSYISRINEMEDEDLRVGLLDLIEGIKSFHSRCLDIISTHKSSMLYSALKRVPFEPAENIYEALVCRNFIYYIDGCDNIGNIDSDLFEYYKGENITAELRYFFENVDKNNGWSGSLGPNYNPITLQCLEASKGMRRPSLELRITKDMPQEIWDAAMDCISKGGGSPSLYNEDAYQKSLKGFFPYIPDEDLMKFSGGGCTETMLAGLCNVGSLDAGINIAYIFEKYMNDTLPYAKSFDEFYDGFIEVCNKEITNVLNSVSQAQKIRSEILPQPVRTLLTDDCIEKEKDFNDGGARYNWSVINIAGLINVIDSFLTINKVIFEDKAMDGNELISFIKSGKNLLNYPGIPRHGMDNEDANKFASRISSDICAIFDKKTPYLGGKFLPSSIQFITYVDAGKKVGATPDGRGDGEPLCDSIGAIHNNDINGPTALMNSCSSLCQNLLLGTPVLNLSLTEDQVKKGLKGLIMGYFENGGLQIQVTCVNKDDLKDALINPQKHPNLVVRVGGYSEYFNRLTEDMKKSVIDRTLF